MSDRPGKDVQVIFLAFADLNQALLGKNLDAIMQSEPQSSQAINKGFGVEVMKPYDTPIGAPVRTMVMSEKFYKEKRAVAAKFMTCFVQATKLFIDNKGAAEKYVRESMFKNQITKDDFDDAIENSPYTYDITRGPHPDHHRRDGQDRHRQDAQAAGRHRLGQDRPAGAGQEIPRRSSKRSDDDTNITNGARAPSAWSLPGRHHRAVAACAMLGWVNPQVLPSPLAVVANGSNTRCRWRRSIRPTARAWPGCSPASCCTTPWAACTAWWSASPSAPAWPCRWAC